MYEARNLKNMGIFMEEMMKSKASGHDSCQVVQSALWYKAFLLRERYWSASSEEGLRKRIPESEEHRAVVMRPVFAL